MTTLVFDLIFREPQEVPETLPVPAGAQVYLKFVQKNAQGTICLTPDCLSFPELDHEINELIKELGRLREIGRTKFSKALAR